MCTIQSKSRFTSRKQYVYLDYAATTPLDPRVASAMEQYSEEYFGNPSSLHSIGQAASRVVENARRAIGTEIGAMGHEIIFTGSATEANNIALRGAVKQVFRCREGDLGMRKRLFGNMRLVHPRVIVSSIEHESVLETANDLANDGVDVVIMPVSKNGVVSIRNLRKLLTPETVLVSVMYANNELGTIQPITDIAEIIRDFRKSNNHHRVQPSTPNPPASSFQLPASSFQFPLFHTDAVQALQFLSCDVTSLGADLITFSAHKVYGPKGVGALYIKGGGTGGPLAPIITGGGQEFGIRAGTESVVAIAGFEKAVLLAARRRARERARIAELRNYLWIKLREACRDITWNAGKLAIEREALLPNFLNVFIPACRNDELLTRLDRAGIAASSGSACSGRTLRRSHVLEAIGFPKYRVEKSIRFTLGRKTTRRDINRAAASIKKVFNACRTEHR